MEKAKVINTDIKELTYGSHHYDRMLNKDRNIGKNGANLTIMVLSCNRSSSTIKMMETIEEYMPDFRGIYLIIDNGSTEEELKLLEKEINKVSYKCELIKLGKNYGVAGGRNKGIKYVKTEWFMSLDNDIYFTCNPLEKIVSTIALLGCHFINFPLLDESGKKLFANGGNIFLYKHYNKTAKQFDIHFGGGSLFEIVDCEPNHEYDPSLGTFLFGGAAILKKDTFIKCGGFDENMFVGFEDYDFSITLFNEGYKIGNMGLVCLVHDHKIPENKDDIEYEKTRFSNEKLMESALYFEKKHGFKVWNEETESWIREKHKQLKIEIA